MGTLGAIRNVIQCYGWSFRCDLCVAEPSVVRPGDSVGFRIVIQNNGLRLGTVYPIVVLAEPYDRTKIVFSSDEHLDSAQQRGLRIVDIPPFQRKQCSMEWKVPSDLKPSLYYLSCEIWNAPRAFADTDRIARAWSYRFNTSNWTAALEVVPRHGTVGGARKVFISYAAFSDAHREWVTALRNQLVRSGIDIVLAETDLHSPMEITLFMEQNIRDADAVILVCSDTYVSKADARRGGVGYETVITSKMFADADPGGRRWIPVLRDNSLPAAGRIPTYLGSTMWIDMNHSNWEERPLADLVRSIRRIGRPGVE
jgi:hypothetical protein